MRERAGELAKFGTVGVAGIVVDAGVFNLLLLGPLADADKVITAKIIASVVATLFAWVAHRWWTFRTRRGHRPLKELIIFALVNGAAVGAQALVLAISHHWWGFTGPVADNFFAYGVGLPLGTIMRYLGYRMFVFNDEVDAGPEAPLAVAATADDDGLGEPPAHAK